MHNAYESETRKIYQHEPALSEDLLLTKLLSTVTLVLSFFSEPSAFFSST